MPIVITKITRVSIKTKTSLGLPVIMASPIKPPNVRIKTAKQLVEPNSHSIITLAGER
jgi:hypothetical protein